MDTDFLSLNHPKAIPSTLEIIKTGGVVAFPTDTVYGIGVSAFLGDAIERIFQIKGRSHLKAIPILISRIEDLDLVTTELNSTAKKIINTFWPGALTIVLPKLPSLPENISPTNTIGIRIPDDNLTRELLRRSGPLAATSANLSGMPSAMTALEVLDQLGGKIDLILDGGPSKGGQASTVVDLTTEQLHILREGPISLNDLNQSLGKNQ
jgi:L-threonylcarbamoyladenylate synthase